MIVWDTLEKDTADWLNDLGEKTLEDTAAFFANSYAATVKDGDDGMMNGVIDPAKEAAIESAWKAALEAQYKSDIPIGVPNWLPVASSIVAYWAGAMFKFSIPHSGTVTGVSNVVINPGVPPPIAAAIDGAFKEEDADKVAAKLVTGYKDHAGMVMGLFKGLTPPPASAPLHIPWTGIK